jgi:hypothetical protein
VAGTATSPIVTDGSGQISNASTSSAGLAPQLTGNPGYVLTESVGGTCSFQPASGGGGSGVQKITGVTVDFGTLVNVEDTRATATVGGQSWVTANSVITATLSQTQTADHDFEDGGIEGVSAVCTNLVPGVSFDIIATAIEGSRGTYKFDCIGIP